MYRQFLVLTVCWMKLNKAVCPVFWDALKPEPLPVEPSGVPGQRTTKSINPTGQYWYSQGTLPQTIIPSSPEPLRLSLWGSPS